VFERQNVEISKPTVLDAQLFIAAEKQVVKAADNGSAIVLEEKELAALSDDPDELSEQLQALAGPGGGRPPPYPHLHLSLLPRKASLFLPCLAQPC
jgi:hypothetical protein